MFYYTYNRPFAFIYQKMCHNFIKKEFNIFIFQTFDFNTKDKFVVVKDFLSSPFHNSSDKKLFIDLVCKTQKVLNIFNKLYSKIKSKKTLIYDCTLDLNLNPLYLLKNKYKFTFTQNYTQFTFSIRDFIKIIQSNLLNHDLFFSDPKFPRNPYTNLIINESIIYNFYFHLNEYGIKIPELIHRFFNSSLNVDTFLRKNECLLREMIIENYPNELTLDKLYEEIVLFLRIIKVNSIFLHIDFPKKIVVNTFVKYYNYYMHSRFDLTYESRDYNKKMMVLKLNDFLKNNKTFGRVIIKRNEKIEHGNYKIINLLSLAIPDLKNLDEIYSFMEFGKFNYDNLDSDDDSYWDENEENDYDEELEQLNLIT